MVVPATVVVRFQLGIVKAPAANHKSKSLVCFHPDWNETALLRKTNGIVALALNSALKAGSVKVEEKFAGGKTSAGSIMLIGVVGVKFTVKRVPLNCIFRSFGETSKILLTLTLPSTSVYVDDPLLIARLKLVNIEPAVLMAASTDPLDPVPVRTTCIRSQG